MKLLLAGLVLSASLDVGTTCVGVNRGYLEMNPIYGSNPSCTRVALTKAAGTGALVLLTPKKHRKAAFITVIAVNAAVVGWNLHQLHK